MNYTYKLEEILVDKNFNEGDSLLIFCEYCNGVEPRYVGKMIVSVNEGMYNIYPEEKTNLETRTRFLDYIREEYVERYNFDARTDECGYTPNNISTILQTIANINHIKETLRSEKELLEEFEKELKEYHMCLKPESEMIGLF